MNDAIEFVTDALLSLPITAATVRVGGMLYAASIVLTAWGLA